MALARMIRTRKARQVFHAPKAVSESRRLAADQDEGDAERDRGRGVAEVVDRVGQQGNGTGQEDHHKLQGAVTAKIAKDHLIAQMPRVSSPARIDDAVRVAVHVVP